MPRLPTRLALVALLGTAGLPGTASAQGAPHQGPHRAAPAQAAPAQTPPTADQMQQMMQTMGRMTPQQMQQMQDAMMQRMTPEQRARMMQGGMMGGAAPGAPAQPGGAGDPHAHGAPGAQGAATAPSTAAFLAANERMHREMALEFTGDADRDFAAAMIPHHEGAIEMARIQIQYGRDPDMRRLAEAVIREQEREIAELRAFLARQR